MPPGPRRVHQALELAVDGLYRSRRSRSEREHTRVVAGLLFNRDINRTMVDTGGHALLLSATLGSEARDRLLIQPTRHLQPGNPPAGRMERCWWVPRPSSPGWMVKSPAEHEENARITDRTSTELRFHWGGGNFVYNRHGLDFAEDTGGGPSSPVRKGRRRRE